MRDSRVVDRNFGKAAHQVWLTHLHCRCIELEPDLADWEWDTPRQAEQIPLSVLDALLSLHDNPGIDTTNWRAEQAIRPAVESAKVRSPNRTWREAATQGRIMSVLRTANHRGIDPSGLLVRRIRAPDPGAIDLFAGTHRIPCTDERPVTPRHPRKPSAAVDADADEWKDAAR